MKNITKKIAIFLVMALLTTNLFNIALTTVSAKTKVKLNKTKVTLTIGKTYTLKVKGIKKKVKWSSSNRKVATISSKGKVRAKKKGKTIITAKVGKKKYKCKVTVKPKKTIPVKKQKTIKENRQELINYIKNNGEVTSNGDYELNESNYITDSNGKLRLTYYSIRTDSQLSSISFGAAQVSEKGSEIVSLTTFGLEDEVAKIYSLYDYKEYITYVGTCEINMSKFDINQKINFNLTNNSAEKNTQMDNAVQDVFYSGFKISLLHAELIMESKLDMTLKDLGINYSL